MAITSRALAFASRWFDPQTVECVFHPLVADWQREWMIGSWLTLAVLAAIGSLRVWVVERSMARA